MDRPFNDYATHLPALVYSVCQTEGDVLELGAGVFSTSVLHYLVCPENVDRRLITAEEDVKWLIRLRDLSSDRHDMVHVKDWDKFLEKIKDYHFSVVFVDCESPETLMETRYEVRKKLIYALQEQADVFVIHDTEIEWFVKDKVWQDFCASFKYHWIDKTTDVWTTVLSNVIDVKPRFEEK